MIIVLKPHTTKDDVSRVENMVKKRGLDTHIVQGKEMTVIGCIVDTKDPAKVEKELKALLDPEKSNDFCHRCVLHGRAVCIARRPNCPACVMNGFCGYYLKQK